MINNAAGYNTYQRNKILMASPAELTLMLYDGAIKFANKAIMAIEKGHIEDANDNIIKTQRIIAEFRSTLNFKYPVAKEFDTVYEYLERRLIQANMEKSTEILEECLEHLRTMRDTWSEVMKINKGVPEEG